MQERCRAERRAVRRSVSMRVSVLDRSVQVDRRIRESIHAMGRTVTESSTTKTRVAT